MGVKTRALNQEAFGRYIGVILAASDREVCYAALCAIIIGTAARIGEAIQHRVGDLFGPDGLPLARITRPVLKKRREVRRTTDFLWEVLGAPVLRWHEIARKRFLLERNDYLFSMRWNNQPVSRVHAWRVNKGFLQRAGIDPAGVAFHGIRKSFLTRMFYRRYQENGGDFFGAMRYVQELAQHESMFTTLLYLQDEIFGTHADTMKHVFAEIMNTTEFQGIDKPMTDCKIIHHRSSGFEI